MRYAVAVTRARFVDSHTEGEPTRVLLPAQGGLWSETLPQLLARWTHNGTLVVPPEMLAAAQHPRAAEATVCALLCGPSKPSAHCGALYWNANGALGMCGHATIGLARTLTDLGSPIPPRAVIETRVGDVTVEMRADGRVAFDNIAARVHARDVEVVLEQGGSARGDIAWGGNWFFIVRLARPMRSHAEELAFASSIERAIARQRLRAGSENGGVIDHVALIFPPSRADAHARNFVLCPNGTFDRSPCGTGTSALMACLADRGELAEGTRFRQESAIGSIFEAHYTRTAAGAVIPTIAGRAFVLAEGTLSSHAHDPTARGAWSESL